MKAFKKQAGFTLVEIAIVLVIVGLLLAGVLKGQELIENSKIKSISKDMDGLGAAVLAYRDRYKALPGDDTRGSASYGWVVGATPIAGGNGDGIIGAAIPNFVGGSAEQLGAIRAMRAAGFLGGDPQLIGVAGLPAHAGGGVMAIGGQAATVWGMPGNVVCLNNLTGKFAGALDRLIDDGVNSTGVVRANNAAIAAAAPAQADYLENTTGYFLCKQL
jgi:prepilin-type N-terminal cleavage/methylation domain-containing protein